MNSYESFPKFDKKLQKNSAAPTQRMWAGWAVPYDWRKMRPPPIMNKGQISFPFCKAINDNKKPLLQRTDTSMKPNPEILAKMSPAVWQCIKDNKKIFNGSCTAE